MVHPTIAEIPFLHLIILLPLLSSVFVGVFGRRLGHWLPGWIATGSVLGSFYYSLKAAGRLHQAGHGGMLTEHLWTWIQTKPLTVDVALFVDPLTLVMLLVVTGVGFLIHLYSIGYMHDDHESSRYFSHLNLFVAFMLILVMGKNLPMLFVGWEGVGACSYLLIGYYFREENKAVAGKKAFIVNRVGDVGFVLGMMVLLLGLNSLKTAATGSLDFHSIAEHAQALEEEANSVPEVLGLDLDVTLISLVCFLLFVGATGKSAQIPLHVWLPDAMAGPTPVSALIHAATMVTAGVYMVCRMSMLYSRAPAVLGLIAWVGAITALFAGLIALKQRDIKKVLAYSTVSQLGYMFMACGAGAYSLAVFHLFTHAFFKALLFLGAGSVIHALSGEQDIFKMGGLQKKLPVTHITFLIGTLALAGFPPLAGFFSKDHILWAAFNSRVFAAPALYLVGLLSAALTAFYMFRLMSLVFWGESHLEMSKKEKKAIHESPDAMVIPLIVLAGFSIVAGFANLPDVIPGGAGHLLGHFLHPSFHEEFSPAGQHGLEGLLMLIAIAVAASSSYLAYLFYTQKDWKPHLQYWGSNLGTIGTILENKFYIDELYHLVFTRPLLFLSGFFKEKVDEGSIDGVLVRELADNAKGASRGLASLQNGDVQRYLVAITLSALAVIMYMTLDIGARP